MADGSLTAYDPNDPTQAAFLSSLALGETGGASNAYSLGTGGVDLTSQPTDAFGFPLWQGSGNSHAAGAFQFQPATWDSLAQQFNLDFSNPGDQNAGAWIEAQQTYTAKTGGSLEDALKAGNFGAVQTSLASIWPSVTGNAATPQGIAHDLANGIGATLPASSGGVTSTPAPSFDIMHPIASSEAIAQNLFVRGGLIIVGAVIVLVALWFLLSSKGIVPSPADVGHAAIAAI